MSLGGGQQQLEALSQEIEELEEAEDELERQIESLESEKIAIDEAIEGIQTLETGSTVQVPLGGDAYVRAEIAAIDEIVVGIGAEYAVEQPEESAIEVLESRKEDLDDRIAEYRSQITEVQEERAELEQRVQQSQEQLMQEQLQDQSGANPDS